jgi:hypothetical protein
MHHVVWRTPMNASWKTGNIDFFKCIFDNMLRGLMELLNSFLSLLVCESSNAILTSDVN